ncbi:MAG: ABC transporter substrate-binding protein [Sulfurimonas sp.]|uniref:Tgt2/MlaC family protein n=1 Tax=Sulfurimonas sp. TaxID=2022749 RepID=UPI0026024A02|nr:ABC transporter substrate-binding protein [Sulfurimonas sp.]MDD5373192.1 ABC transporter substrate-binding protein [Sulfurimonas sp.]
MKKVYKNVMLMLFFIMAFGQNLAANEQVELKKHFLKKIDEVILVVEDKKLSKDSRNGNIIKCLTPMFDFELMAKLSLGNKWKELSKENQDKFVALYVERMKQSYSSKIDAYKDEKVEVKKIDQSQEGRIAFVTDLVSKEQKLEIVYKFHKPKEKRNDKDSWLIYDVEILGVSILKTDIAQFKEFLQTKSITELIDALSKQS